MRRHETAVKADVGVVPCGEAGGYGGEEGRGRDEAGKREGERGGKRRPRDVREQGEPVDRQAKRCGVEEGIGWSRSSLR
jgi:hypothetical protein